MSFGEKKPDAGPRVNEQIRVPQIRLLGDDGEQFGIVDTSEARRIAHDRGLDLIEVSPTAKPPVVKLIDYGKYKYELQKKANEAKKKQAIVQLKELQFRPNIEKHDLEVKLKKIQEFLDDGDKVKMVMQFKGREMAHQAVFMEKFRGILAEALSMGGMVESELKMMGNRAIVILAPAPKKK